MFIVVCPGKGCDLAFGQSIGLGNPLLSIYAPFKAEMIIDKGNIGFVPAGNLIVVIDSQIIELKLQLLANAIDALKIIRCASARR